MALDADRVHRTIRKLRKLLADPEARPSTEHIHDLRTSTRRLAWAMVRRRRGPAKVAARKRLPMPVLEATAAIAS